VLSLKYLIDIEKIAFFHKHCLYSQGLKGTREELKGKGLLSTYIEQSSCPEPQ